MLTRIVSTGGSVLATVLGYVIGTALIIAVVAGGLFYRESCPSQVKWSFDPIPFVSSYTPGQTDCTRDTATGYYAGKVPVVGGLLRGIVHSMQDDGSGRP